MKTVGTYEAKAHLPQLLDEVERGEEIMITRHGHPVARLAAYLDLALRESLPRATLDRALARAARQAGVALFE